jgi:hypothetical protein
MNLTSSLSNYCKKKAYESYLNFVFESIESSNIIICYSKDQRKSLIAKLTREAVLACDHEPTNQSKFIVNVDTRFANPEVFLKAYKEFEIEQAKLAGLLEPSKLVDDLTVGIDLNYKQKSTLESYAIVALYKSKELGHCLAEMLDYVYEALKGTSAYSAAVSP